MNASTDATQQVLHDVSRLDAGLRDLREQWLEQSNKPGFAGFEPWQERLAAHQCLEQVVSFLDAVPSWRKAELSWALARLLFALNEVEEGNTVPWLLPSKRRGAPLKPHTVEMLRGHCAAVMHFLVQAGCIRKDAAEFVLQALGAKAAQRLSGRRSAGAPTWKTIDKWREPLTGHANPSVALEGFRQQTAILERDRGIAEVAAVA